MGIRIVEPIGPEILVEVEGSLEPEDVEVVARVIASSTAVRRLEVDLRRAAACPAHPMVLLQRAARRAGVATRLVGLKDADARLLRYLGENAEAPGRGDPSPRVGYSGA